MQNETPEELDVQQLKLRRVALHDICSKKHILQSTRI